MIGWAIGFYGGRPYLERHGRWLHLDERKLDRAERWFERWEDWAVFLGRVTPVVRSFVSIPAGVFEARFVRYTLLTLLGSAIWCFAFAAAGYAAGEAGRTSTTRSATSSTSSRPRSSRAPRGSPGATSRSGTAPRRGVVRRSTNLRVDLPGATLARVTPADPTHRREGAVRAADSRARGALLRRPRVRPLHLRAGGRGVRARGRGVPRRAARDRRRERHGRPRPRTRGARDRPRRRGRLPGVHVLRDGRGDRARRRDAGVRRHRSGDAQPRSGGRRRADHAADEGDHARAPLRTPGAARGARGARAPARSRTPRRRSAPRASPRRASARRSASSRRRTSSRWATAGS